MESYFVAKASLFAEGRTERALVNLDDPWGRRLLDVPMPVTTFGLDPGADVRAEDVRATVDGVAFRVDGREVTSPLRGAFNVSNCLAAIAASRAVGVEVSAAIEGLASAGQVAGRMEPVEGGQDFLVVVDYAHTPDSIRTVLAAARPLATGRVIVVFGCGGDRDRAKRFPMGAAATEGADLTVITTDNPRSEDPLDIITDVERGAAEGGGRFVVEPDRRAAIRLALAEARPGDVVVVAGKGHETEQELAGGSVPFDDRVVVLEELQSIGRRPVRPRRLSEVARVVEGSFEGDDVEVRSASTDSRDVIAGGLFVALTGERTDGHRFVDQAFAGGAAAVLVERGRRLDRWATGRAGGFDGGRADAPGRRRTRLA